MRVKYSIVGIDCADCALRLENSLRKIKAVQNVSVNFATEKLTLECEDADFEACYDACMKMIKIIEPEAVLTEI